MMKGKLAFAMIVLLGLAGCTGESPATVPTSQGTNAGDDTPASSVPPSGEKSSGETPMNTSSTQVVPLAYDGKVGTRVVVCPPRCDVDDVTPSERFFEPEYEGAPSELQLTLTWTPSSPVMNELRLGYQRCTEAGCEILEKVDGPSPLSIGPASVELAPGEWLRLFVWVASDTAAGVSHDQDFHLEGTLKVVPE